MNEILEVKNIGKKYQNKEGEVQALKNVNFRVKKGEFVSIIGPSGCGKSTTLRIIGGFVKPDEGRVYFNGKDITDLSPDKRNLNTVGTIATACSALTKKPSTTMKV